MKIRFISAILCAPLVLVGCGADEIVYDEPSDDLFACVQGTWNVHKNGESTSNLEHTRTYNSDGSYLDESIAEYQSTSFGSFLNFFGADIPLADYTSKVILEAGHYDVVDGMLYQESLKTVTVTGNDEQTTYNDALSLLASTPDSQDNNIRADSTHCDSMYLDTNVFQKVSESPLTYLGNTYFYYTNDIHNQEGVDTITLYDDGKAAFEKEMLYVNDQAHLENTYENQPGSYEYDVYNLAYSNSRTQLVLRTCGYGFTAEQCFETNPTRHYTYLFNDYGSVLTYKNGHSYYSRP
jgi:hypothetical protein